MGGDQLVAAVAGEQVEQRAGDRIREAESDFYRELIGEVQGMEGSRELIREMRDRGTPAGLASSAKDWEADHYLDPLDPPQPLDPWPTSPDGGPATPEPRPA